MEKIFLQKLFLRKQLRFSVWKTLAIKINFFKSKMILQNNYFTMIWKKQKNFTCHKRATIHKPNVVKCNYWQIARNEMYKQHLNLACFTEAFFHICYISFCPRISRSYFTNQFHMIKSTFGMQPGWHSLLARVMQRVWKVPVPLPAYYAL